LSDRFGLRFALGATWADRDYMQTYFGVTAVQAQATSFSVYHAWPLVGAVDVFVTLGDQTLPRRNPNHTVDAYESLSAYADANSDGRLRITFAGRTELVLFDSASIGLAANQGATLVVSPALGAARVAVAVLPQGLPACVLANKVVTVIQEAKLP
jgi:MltA-interacting protein MipA